jgi:hypothetical protein
MSEEDARELDRLEGIFVGQLTPHERNIFDKAVALHLAWRDYDGLAGFMGMAKVRLVCKT